MPRRWGGRRRRTGCWPHWRSIERPGNSGHLWAETQRQLRGAAIHPADLRDVAASVMEEAIGTDLDAGQKQMVRTVATDRRRVQLVLAPAGAGKTTALKVLADLWTAGGGHVLGLAPSAAAAAQLAEATGITADTLARLTWAIDHNQALPYWADRIGPRTLLLIDEAGMADTPPWIPPSATPLRQGGRVCLVGDDQQLGAIGAGGILADLQTTHGTVRLTQLHLHRPRRSRRRPTRPRRSTRRRRLLHHS